MRSERVSGGNLSPPGADSNRTADLVSRALEAMSTSAVASFGLRSTARHGFGRYVSVPSASRGLAFRLATGDRGLATFRAGSSCGPQPARSRTRSRYAPMSYFLSSPPDDM